MPLEIKKLSAVDVAETLTDDVKVLVEDGGAIKRVSKDQVCGTGVGLPEVDGSGKTLVSVNGEWKQTNGYGYEESAFDPITWDGDIEGRTYFDVGSGLFVKVSDQVLTSDQMIGATLHFNNNLKPDETITESDINSFGGLLSPSFYVITAEAGTYDLPDNYSMTVPESGTYFLYINEDYESYLSSLTASSVIHPIDEKYIPASAKLPDASRLPDYTDDDEGKVLKIVDGVPTWVTP